MSSFLPGQRPSKRSIPAILILTVASLLSAVGLIWTAASTRAAPDMKFDVITVTTLADQFGTDAGACSLREAIEAANSNADFSGCAGPGGNRNIEVGAGIHVLTRIGGADDSNTLGDLDVTASLTITGLGPESTSIEAGATMTDRLMDIRPGATVVISGVRLAGANLIGDGFGAAINVFGRLTLANCIIENNQAPSVGGGIHVGTGGHLTVKDCLIRNNHSMSHGGGIFASGSLTISDSTISANDAGSYGGGISVRNNGQLTLIRTTISENQAPFSGGGIYVDILNEATIVDSTIRGNSAPDSGGIALVRGSLLMVNSALISNTATSAAGMRVTNTLATLVNSTVSGNVAQAGAGGIAVNTANGRLHLYNTTIANNTTNAGASGGNGGGLNIQSGSVVSMTNSVLANNIDLGASGDSPDCFGTIHLVAYNHVENTAGCTITGPATGNVTGSDPNLRALANNGGPTLTHLPNAGSPLIDSGAPAGCAGPDGGILNTDQRGFFRPFNGGSALRCDKGSTERGSFQMRLALPMIAR